MLMSIFVGPDASPHGILVLPISSTSFYVSWSAVPAIHQNGILTYYDIEYSQPTIPQLPMTEIVSADNFSILLTDLEKFTEYSVRVRASTSVGTGPYSPPQNETTLEDGK